MYTRVQSFILVILVQLDILDGTLFLIILYCNKRRFLLTSAYVNSNTHLSINQSVTREVFKSLLILQKHW